MTSQRLCDELMTLWCLTKISEAIGKHGRGHKAERDLETKERPRGEEEGETVFQPLWNFACVQLISTQKKYIWDSLCFDLLD